jgi:hypothetical protein
MLVLTGAKGQSAMFRIGQKVVCVDARSPVIRGHHSELSRYLVEGAEYTVTGARVDPWTGIPAIQVDGVPEYYWMQAKRFRPIVEKKTNISAFEEILRRETVDDRAPAQAH